MIMEVTLNIDESETETTELLPGCILPSHLNKHEMAIAKFDLDARLCKSICDKVSVASKNANKITIRIYCHFWTKRGMWGVKIEDVIDMIRGKHLCQSAGTLKARDIDRRAQESAKGHSTFHYQSQLVHDSPSIITMTKKSKLKRKKQIGVIEFHSPILITHVDVHIYADGPLDNPKTSNIKIMGNATVNRQGHSAASIGETYAKVLFDLEKGTIIDITNGGNKELTDVENTTEVIEAIKDLMAN